MCTVIVTQLQTSLLFTSEDSVRVSSSKPSMRPLVADGFQQDPVKVEDYEAALFTASKNIPSPFG